MKFTKFNMVQLFLLGLLAFTLVGMIQNNFLYLMISTGIIFLVNFVLAILNLMELRKQQLKTIEIMEKLIDLMKQIEEEAKANAKPKIRIP